MKRALFPGSFDPFTIGHESVVNRALELFDEIIIAIGYNSEKKGYFPVDKRIEMIRSVYNGNPKIVVEKYNKLTVDYCKDNRITFILRGLRTAADFEYERAIAQMNRFLDHNIHTVFLLTEAEHTPISSTILREVLRYGGDIQKYIPDNIDIKKYM